MSRINVTRSLLPDRKRFHAYVDRILDSGWLTNNSACVQELEGRLEEYLGVKNLVLVNNGTVGLQVAYHALEISGEVITTPFSFIATASSAVWEGLDVVFADIDKNSFNIDVDEIRNKITPQTSAIVPVHIYGNPCEVEAIEELASEYSLKVVYDAAHAFAVKYKGQSILNWGDISVLSFHATKLFQTIEGGALVIKDDELCAKVRKMINFGITGPESIECLRINGKMNEFQAAMGLCVIDEMDATLARRARLAEIYDERLSDAVVKQRLHDGAIPNHGYYPVLLTSEAITERVNKSLNNEAIYPRRYFAPSLNTLSFIGGDQQAPVSEDIARRILCLPLYPELTEEQCQTICEIVLANLEN